MCFLNFNVTRWPKFVSLLEPWVTSNARFGVSIFSNPSYAYFCMCNFISGNNARFALLPETKLHKQKCNTCRKIENPSRRIIFNVFSGTVPKLVILRVIPTRFSICRYSSTVDLPSADRPCTSVVRGAWSLVLQLYSWAADILYLWVTPKENFFKFTLSPC